MNKIFILLHLLLFIFSAKGSEFRIPSLASVGDTVTITCGVDVSNSKILSVTWLKDDVEFYRYHFIPAKVDFVSAVRGISVDRSDVFPNGNIIRINLLTRESCGRYKCFIELEHPVVKFAEMSGTMKVVEPQPFLTRISRELII